MTGQQKITAAESGLRGKGKVEGDAARTWAREHELTDPDEVVSVKAAGHIGCLWVYRANGFGDCLACGDIDFPMEEDDD